MPGSFQNLERCFNFSQWLAKHLSLYLRWNGLKSCPICDGKEPLSSWPCYWWRRWCDAEEEHPLDWNIQEKCAEFQPRFSGPKSFREKFWSFSTSFPETKSIRSLRFGPEFPIEDQAAGHFQAPNRSPHFKQVRAFVYRRRCSCKKSIHKSTKKMMINSINWLLFAYRYKCDELTWALWLP